MNHSLIVQILQTRQDLKGVKTDEGFRDASEFLDDCREGTVFAVFEDDEERVGGTGVAAVLDDVGVCGRRRGRRGREREKSGREVEDTVRRGEGESERTVESLEEVDFALREAGKEVSWGRQPEEGREKRRRTMMSGNSDL